MKKNTPTEIFPKHVFLACLALTVFGQLSQASSIIVVANGASTGPILTTSASQNLALGTQLRIGAFGNLANLTNSINTWKAGTTANSAGEVAAARSALFNSVLSTLNSNFTDLGAGGVFGSPSQTGTTVAGKFVVNTTASLTVNGSASTYNVANGQITTVTPSSAAGIGTGKQLYLWASYNDEIGIFTDSTWVAPADLSNLTMNLNAVSNLAAEILLGSYIDNATGNDFLGLGATTVTVIPEPSSLSLFGLGAALLVLRRRSIKHAARKTNHQNILIVTALACSLAGQAFSQTVSTPVVGFYKKSYPAGGSLQTFGLQKAAVYSGTTSSFTANSINLAGASLQALGLSAGLPTHYLEVTSGSLLGYVADVTSNTATSVQIDGDLSSVLGTLLKVVIRPHTKLSEILKTATSLADYDGSVTIYNSDGTQSVFLKDSSVTSGWLDATTFAETDAVIYPNCGFILNNSTAGEFVVTGQVRTSPILVPLYANQVNIVSLANPGGGSTNIQSIGLGSNLIDFADSVTTYLQDGSLLPENTLLWAGAADGFYDATSFTPAVSVNAQALVPVIVSPTATTTWLAPAPINP